METLRRAGIEYRGYLPNLEAPAVYAQSRLALHVPRRQYANGLSGMPTIRVFEALACGIPLLCSPWTRHRGPLPAGRRLPGCGRRRSRCCGANAKLLRDRIARAASLPPTVWRRFAGVTPARIAPRS